MKIRIKGRQNKEEELGSTIIEIKENPELSEEEKNKKITEKLIDAARYAGRVNRSFRDRFPGRLVDDYLELSTIRRLALDHLPENEKVKVLKEVVNAYMNVVRVYEWKDSYDWVDSAVYTAEKIPGREGIKVLEELGNEFLRRNWTWSASLVAKALWNRGEKEKATELKRKIDFRVAALELNKKKEYQPHPPPEELEVP
jgi:uncharacterized protein YbcC (UPF0753/DUF2309 family)